MLTRNIERHPSVTVRKYSNVITWFGSGLLGMQFWVWVQDVQIREFGRTPISLKGHLSATLVQLPNLSKTFQGLFLFRNSRRRSRKLCFQWMWSLAVTLEVPVVSVLLRVLSLGQWVVEFLYCIPLEMITHPSDSPTAVLRVPEGRRNSQGA